MGEIVSKELRATLDNPKTRYRIVDVVLAREKEISMGLDHYRVQEDEERSQATPMNHEQILRARIAALEAAILAGLMELETAKPFTIREAGKRLRAALDGRSDQEPTL